LDQALEALRIFICLGFLAYASWSDYKTREISNNVWVAFGPIALILTLAQILFFPSISIGGNISQSLAYYGLSFSITSIFSIILFYVGAYGGADAKALMCIALAMPFPPDLANPLSGFVSLFFPITVFSNGVIIAVFSVFYALGRNLLWRFKENRRFFEGYENVSIGHKILTLLCGYKVSIKKLKESFLYPLEDFRINQQGKKRRYLLLFPKDEDRDNIIERVAKAVDKGEIKSPVWATPGLPMLIFITLGFILALIVGDFVWIAINPFIG
jgi:preflagellin peptidase FlaK